MVKSIPLYLFLTFLSFLTFLFFVKIPATFFTSEIIFQLFIIKGALTNLNCFQEESSSNFNKQEPINPILQKHLKE